MPDHLESFSLDRPLAELVDEVNGLKDYLLSLGIAQVSNPMMLRTLGRKVKLRQGLKMRGISEERFWRGWCERRTEQEGYESAASGLTASSAVLNGDAERILHVDGILPCPVKLPLANFITESAAARGIRIVSDFVSASLGLDAMKERLRRAEAEGNDELLPDLLCSAGFDFFFSRSWQENFVATGKYRAPDKAIHPEFAARGAELRDPRLAFHILAVVPTVLIVRRSDFPDGDYPRTWDDVIEKQFPNGVAVPHGDLDLFNAIALTVLARYGIEGVRKLAANSSHNLHPSQMAKPGEIRPSVSVAPYFFASMLRDPDLFMVWPEDGAIISPIFLTLRENNTAAKELAELLYSEEAAEILAHKGKFPATCPSARNELEADRRFMWVGWDYLYSHDIAEDMERCIQAFSEAEAQCAAEVGTCD